MDITVINLLTIAFRDYRHGGIELTYATPEHARYIKNELYADWRARRRKGEYHKYPKIRQEGATLKIFTKPGER